MGIQLVLLLLNYSHESWHEWLHTEVLVVAFAYIVVLLVLVRAFAWREPGWGIILCTLKVDAPNNASRQELVMIVKILRPAGLVHGNVAWEVLMSDGTTKLMSTPDIVSLTPRR